MTRPGLRDPSYLGKGFPSARLLLHVDFFVYITVTKLPPVVMQQKSPTRPSLLIALPAIIALGMIMVGCTPQAAGDQAYRHSELGYEVTLPERWRGLYEVNESVTEEDGIRIASFDYTGGEPESFVFRIAAYPVQTWNVMMPTLNTEPFARTDDHVFALIRALDNPYTGEAQDEYGRMAQDIDAIIGSFKLEGAEPAGEETETVVYFANDQLNPNVECGTVHPVSRDAGGHPDRRFAMLSELLRGPTEAERAEGYSSFFSGQTADALRSLSVQNSTAYVNLRDLRAVIPNASSSCGSAALMAQIESTLMQFPEIERVIVAFDGSTQTFYDWIQIGCGPHNDDCDDAPFRSGSQAE